MEVPVLDDLDGQVALVTGANRGIGSAIAAALAAKGARVHAGRRDPDADVPQGTHAVALDVTDPDGVEAAVEAVVDREGHLDILVNNAGTLQGGSGELEHEPPDGIAHVLRTNLLGPMLVTRAAIPHLTARPGGRVVNVSSGMGALEGMNGGHPSYRVSKTGLNGFTVYLDAAYGQRGLVANAACPGWVHTEMGGRSAPRSLEEGADTPVWLASFAPDAPGGRFWRDRHVIPW